MISPSNIDRDHIIIDSKFKAEHCYKGVSKYDNEHPALS